MPKSLRPLARKLGKRWSTCTGTCFQALPVQEYAATESGSTCVTPGGVGGTTSVPLCALRSWSPSGLSLLAPEGYGAARPSAGGAAQAAICAPVRTTGAASRASARGPEPVALGRAAAGTTAAAVATADITASRRGRIETSGGARWASAVTLRVRREGTGLLLTPR